MPLIYNADTTDSWEILRNVRDKLLANSDWTQVSDAPLTPEQKAAWATYRQTLRDLPANTTDPNNPTLPEQPEN